MTLTFFLCIPFFLLTITPRFCCNYANYITRSQPDDRAMSYNKQLIDTVGKEYKGGTELVNENKKNYS